MELSVKQAAVFSRYALPHLSAGARERRLDAHCALRFVLFYDVGHTNVNPFLVDYE